MSEPSLQQPRTADVAVVLRPERDQAEVLFGDGAATVGYGAAFRPRADSLTPGHLVAVAALPGADRVVIWRWFDAVVLEQSGEQVRLWEPGHGEVLATARTPGRAYAPGTRAYASAGLPGADWWVEGPVGPVEQADVAVDRVLAFYDEHDLWGRRT